MKIFKKKIYIIAITFISLGLICGIIYSIIGSYVDETGVLHEPFALIPIGYFLALVGIILGCIGLIKSIFTKKNK